jgi:hypothetical protein
MDLSAEVMINAPASEAWVVLGERFGQIGEWAAPITESTLEGEPEVGAVRTCHIARFGLVEPGVIKERLIAFDPEALQLAYEAIEGMPSFIQGAINRWSVHSLADSRCLVRTQATLWLRAPFNWVGFLFKWSMQANGARVLDELKHQVEQGRAPAASRPSPTCTPRCRPLWAGATSI